MSVELNLQIILLFQPTRLNVFRNDADSWDYTNSALGGMSKSVVVTQCFCLHFATFCALFFSSKQQDNYKTMKQSDATCNSRKYLIYEHTCRCAHTRRKTAHTVSGFLITHTVSGFLITPLFQDFSLRHCNIQNQHDIKLFHCKRISHQCCLKHPHRTWCSLHSVCQT